jgi:L-ribulose-5-phosphate 3-epimerase
MSFYKAINSWVIAGFGGERSPYDAICDAKSYGLDGVELTVGDCVAIDTSADECAKIKAFAAEKGIGLRSVASGFFWGCSLGAAEETERVEAVTFAKKYLQIAAWLGAESALIVPGAVDVAWDPSRPVVPYTVCWNQATKSMRELIPVAEAVNVNICLENVWNKFLYSPMEMKQFIDQFGTRKIGCYFDVGNCLLNGYPQDWIEVLGRKIKAVHFKNWKSEDCGGGLHGFGDDLLEGEVEFDKVLAALEKIGYTGPVTVEMIPFSRLPDLVMPDLDLAKVTAEKMLSIFT